MTETAAEASTPPAPERARRGLAEKRQALFRGARTIFARDGYTRASIDAIAREAGVSTRTIYNHFTDKKQLFQAVILQSASQVRDSQLAEIDRHLGKVVDLEADMIALGRTLALPPPEFDAHFALVRQIRAESGHIPVDVLETWQEAGPRSVHAALARNLGRLADEGRLAIDDPHRAAAHFVLLASSEVASRALPLDAAEIDTIITSGVRAFLRAYAPSRQG